MKSVLFQAKGMIGGEAKGPALVSKLAFTFAHGVDPDTGTVTDIRSDLKGLNVKGKVLFFPFGKGSTTASAWFLETARLGNAPSAVVTRAVDLSMVIGSVLTKSLYSVNVPVLSGFPEDLYAAVRTGDLVQVDGAKGEITVEKP